jgi:hypothetical protein
MKLTAKMVIRNTFTGTANEWQDLLKYLGEYPSLNVIWKKRSGVFIVVQFILSESDNYQFHYEYCTKIAAKNEVQKQNEIPNLLPQ